MSNKKSSYEKYVTAFNREKKRRKSGWSDPEMLTKSEWDMNRRRFVYRSDKEAINDIVYYQKWGYSRTEGIGRKSFYEAELKGKVKWTSVKGMSHDEFVETYKDELSQMYAELSGDASIGSSGAAELIAAYVFGSD